MAKKQSSEIVGLTEITDTPSNTSFPETMDPKTMGEPTSTEGVSTITIDLPTDPTKPVVVAEVDYREVEKHPGPGPRNVYKELVDGKYVIWWTTDDSKVVGKVEEVETNPQTLISAPRRGLYSIPYNAQNKAKVIKQMTPRTKFYHKNLAQTSKVTKEDF